MDVFVVSLFGHREIDDLRQLEERLAPIVRELLTEGRFISFLIGRHGDFDEYAASIIKRIQKDTGKENSEMILVLPYAVADMTYYEAYYDSIIIPDDLHGLHPKNTIFAKNKWMVEQSDLVLAYVTHPKGGAYKAMKYAEGLNKKIINFSEEKE